MKTEKIKTETIVVKINILEADKKTRLDRDDFKKTNRPEVIKTFLNNKKGNKECFDFLKENKKSFDLLPERIAIVIQNKIDSLGSYKRTIEVKALRELLETLPVSLKVLRQEIAIENI